MVVPQGTPSIENLIKAFNRKLNKYEEKIDVLHQ
jgi:hypothetical protein